MDLNAQQIEMGPVETLAADPRNVKTHPDAQVRQIAASMRQFGFNDPIAVDQHGMIVEGHGRLLGARMIGMTEVPVIRLHFENAAQRKAYAIAHNQIQALSPMDNREVIHEMGRLGVPDIGDEAMGYTQEDITFLRFEEQRIAQADEANGGGGEGARFASARVLRSMIPFASQPDMIQWYSFIDWLRAAFPEAITIAEALDAFVVAYTETLHDL